MAGPLIDLYLLPGGAMLIAATVANPGASARELLPGASARELLIDGRPPVGGWLFHRGAALDGGHRLTWIGRRPTAEPRSVRLVAAAGDPSVRRHPEFSVAGYLAGFASTADRIGLVRQLVESAPGILGIKGDAGFDALRAEALEAALAESAEQPPAALYRLPAGMTLLLLSGPATGCVAVHLLAEGRATRSTFLPVDLAIGRGRRAAVLLQTGEAATAALVGRSELVAVPISRAGSRLGASDLLALVRGSQQGGADLARYLLTALAPSSGGEPALARLLDELAALMPVLPPSVLNGDGALEAELALAFASPGGAVVAAGTLRDPHGLLEHVEWQGGSHAINVPADSLLRLSGPDGSAGFVATLPAPAAARRFRQHSFELVTRGGSRIRAVAPPVPAGPAAQRDQLLKFLHAHPDDDRLMSRLQPLVAELQASHLAGPRVAEVIEVGQPPADPAVSLVIPLYRTLSFLRPQAAAFAADPAMRHAEVVLVLDSPEQRDELLAILHGLHAVYGLAARVVVHARNLGYAPAVNSGAAVARAPMLMLLNSDIVPADSRWMPAMLGRHRKSRRVGAVGPKLLYGDDSLQHAGLTFAVDPQGRYYNTHFFKGYPRDFRPAARARRVPGLTGACLMIEAEVFRSVGGICEDYVVGDFEDSDLSLRLAAEGLSLWYEPAAELYHYERESMARNESYTETAACRYNQYIHTSRWKYQLQRVIDSNLGC